MYIKSTLLFCLVLSCLISCADPADAIINTIKHTYTPSRTVGSFDNPQTIPSKKDQLPMSVKVSEFDWAKHQGVWEGRSGGRKYSHPYMTPADPNAVKAIEKYMGK